SPRVRWGREPSQERAPLLPAKANGQRRGRNKGGVPGRRTLNEKKKKGRAGYTRFLSRSLVFGFGGISANKSTTSKHNVRPVTLGKPPPNKAHMTRAVSWVAPMLPRALRYGPGGPHALYDPQHLVVHTHRRAGCLRARRAYGCTARREDSHACRGGPDRSADARQAAARAQSCAAPAIRGWPSRFPDRVHTGKIGRASCRERRLRVLP